MIPRRIDTYNQPTTGAILMKLSHLNGLRLALASLLLAAVALAVACGDDDEGEQASEAATPEAEASTLNVVASTTIVEDLVRQVGGDRVSVESIVPTGADPHTFIISPSDIRKTAEADLLVIVGAQLGAIEGDLERSTEGAVLELTHGMDLRPFPEGLAHAEDDHDEEEGEDHGDEDEDEGEDHGDEEEEEGEDHGDEDEEEGEDHGDEDEEEGEDHGDEDEEEGDDHGDEDEEEGHGDEHGAFDPHFWMDIDFAVEAVEAIRDELSRLDPDGADYYRERAEAYIAELRELDTEIREQLAGLPEERRYLVTFHDAYGYFAARYGLTILGFVVEGPEEQPSASAITELVERITELGIPFVFSEPQFSARVIEQIARDTDTTVRAIPSGALAEEYPTYVEFLRAIANGIAE